MSDWKSRAKPVQDVSTHGTISYDKGKGDYTVSGIDQGGRAPAGSSWKDRAQNVSSKPSAQAIQDRFNKDMPAPPQVGTSPEQFAAAPASHLASAAAVGLSPLIGGGMLLPAAYNAGTSGLAAYLAPGTDDEKMASAKKAAAISGLSSLLLGGVGKILSRGADKTMQSAVGMTKDTPGVGNRLIDQGIIGTKNGMAEQVAGKMPGAEAQVNQAVDSLRDANGQPMSFPSESMTDPLNEVVKNRYTLDNGKIPGNVQGYANSVRHYAQGIGDSSSAGSFTPQDLLKLKRQGDWLGYNASGNPAASLEGELGGIQGDTARGLLSSASEGATKEALANEQALILARKGLTKPDKISGPSIGAKLFANIPGSSLMQSAAAQGMQKGIATPATALATPSAQQLLLQKYLQNQSTQTDDSSQ